MLSYSCDFLFLSDQHDVETFKEAHETQDAISLGNDGQNRGKLLLQLIQVTLDWTLVKWAIVFFDDVIEFILRMLSISFLQYFNHMLASQCFISANENEKFLRLPKHDLANIERPREKVHFCVHTWLILFNFSKLYLL